MTSLHLMRSGPARILFIVLLGSFLTLPGLAPRIPLYKGEPREGIVVQKMVTRGDWILPLRYGQIPSKPPLFHWLAAITSLAGGRLSELTVRLPSAILGVLAALICLRFGTALLGEGAGFLGAIVLLTSPKWLRFATSARVDMTLAFFVLVSLTAFYRWSECPTDRRWLYAFYVAMGLATLAKGPVGIVLPVLVVSAFLAWRREWALVRHMAIVQGLVLAIGLASVWYALALWQGGWAFFHTQIIYENVQRFLGGKAPHPHPLYYLPQMLVADMFPWSLFVPAVAISLWRERHRLERGHVYLILWTVVVLIFFTVSRGKRGYYLLPLYPALSLLVGWWGERRLQALRPMMAVPIWLLSLGVTLLAMVGLFGTILWNHLGFPTPAMFLFRLMGDKAAIDWGIKDVVLALSPLTVLAFGAGLTLCWIILFHGVRTENWRTIFAGITLGMICLATATQFIFIPLLAEARSYRSFARECIRHLPRTDPLYLTFARNGSTEILFYAEREIPVFKQPLLPLPAHLDPRTHWILKEEQWELLRPDAAGKLQEVVRSRATGPHGTYHLVLVRLAENSAAVPPGCAPDRRHATKEGS
ncbi:MAG: ArnT family glycosyltransferase [Candidatus Methylomirabilales bacterium]